MITLEMRVEMAGSWSSKRFSFIRLCLFDSLSNVLVFVFSWFYFILNSFSFTSFQCHFENTMHVIPQMRQIKRTVYMPCILSMRLILYFLIWFQFRSVLRIRCGSVYIQVHLISWFRTSHFMHSLLLTGFHIHSVSYFRLFGRDIKKYIFHTHARITHWNKKRFDLISFSSCLSLSLFLSWYLL